MIEIICGEKGKGKTKELLEKVNHTVSTVTGSVVYLDKSQKHMYELNNKVRLINVVDYPITNCDEFLGFICGIVSQDHDLEEMYLDSFLTIAFIESDQDMVRAIEKLDIISEKYKVRFILSDGFALRDPGLRKMGVLLIENTPIFFVSNPPERNGFFRKS